MIKIYFTASKMHNVFMNKAKCPSDVVESPCLFYIVSA